MISTGLNIAPLLRLTEIEEAREWLKSKLGLDSSFAARTYTINVAMGITNVMPCGNSLAPEEEYELALEQLVLFNRIENE